jgi:flavin-dependent dehydrogenase
MSDEFDVVICGGGLAGLSLGRQLKLNLPDLKIAIIDKMARPLPAAAHKVGESSVEIGAHYYGRVIQLEDYLKKSHLPKLGLRFFLGNTQGPVENRPELGAKEFPPVPSYQLDRGILENDLREMNAQAGITLMEGYAVTDIELSSGGDHRVVCENRSEGQTIVVKGRWVVDALGRRRLIQTKLGLKKPNGHQASAVWFRMPGRLDVSDLVPDSCAQWHARVPDRQRYLSTNHLMGRGYWVWFIPLSSGNTSVGIVTGEADHPYSSYSTPDKAMKWLRTYEPRVADYLEGREMLDFKGLKNYSYGSHQVYSPDLWACVGEAGVFPDPLYSPGSDLIGFGNTITTQMIRMDFEGTLTPEIVRRYDRLFLSLAESAFVVFRDNYSVFGHAQVTTAKVMWDYAVYWAFFAPLLFQKLLSDPELIDTLYWMSLKFYDLHDKVQRLFREWAAKAPSKSTYQFFEFLRFPYFRSLLLDLLEKKPREQCLKEMWTHYLFLENYAEALQYQALEETESAEKMPTSTRLSLLQMLYAPVTTQHTRPAL